MKVKTNLFTIFMFLFIVGCAFAESNIDTFCQDVLNDFKNDKAEALYERMSEETKQAMSYNGMVEFFNLEKDILGDLKQYDKLDMLEHVVDGKAMTTIRYAAHFENTAAIIVLAIIEEGGELSCQNLHVDSLLFAKPEIQKRFEEFSPTSK